MGRPKLRKTDKGYFLRYYTNGQYRSIQSAYKRYKKQHKCKMSFNAYVIMKLTSK